MRSRYLVQPGLLMAAFALGAGCLGDGTDPPSTHDLSRPMDGPVQLAAPNIERGSIPTITCQGEVGVIGSTQPGFNVYATGGASSGITTANSSGRFCLPVSLNRDQLNTINVYATDPQTGHLSAPATLDVTHRSSSDCQTPILDGGVAPDPENVALEAEVTSMEPPKTGMVSALNDGNPSTFALWESDQWVPFLAYDGWVKLTLKKPTAISKIILRWRDNYSSVEKYFGADYKIMVSLTADAGDPQDGGVWTTLKTVKAGDGGEDALEYRDNQPMALHIALWLQFDGETGVTSYDELFALAEFEVYDTPGSTSQPPPTPGVCAGAF
ncbi:MAG: discoidin domain-containing protein [Deltaproteobacteria bacterium]|nr:discoidin domain-containing protein [Deltaproteobacteria bacterium]